MTQAHAPARSRPRGAGKAQLHEAALRLFARDGVDGTSLQAIADEMGVSKAAVYYHYRTKDELVLGVIAPIFERLDAVVEAAAARRTRPARLDEFLTGMVGLIIEHHSRFSVIMKDPYVATLMKSHHDLVRWWERILTGVIGPRPDPPTQFALMMFLGGMTAPLRDETLAALGADAVRDQLLDCGRRLLQLRRRPA